MQTFRHARLQYLRRACGTAVGGLRLLVLAGLLLAPSLASAQTTTPANSSAVTRSASAPSKVNVALSAVLTEDGQPIDQGLIWHVFREHTLPEDKRVLVSQIREAAPRLKLDPGEYMINAAFGRATLTRKIVVEDGKPLTEVFNLNAGGLRIKAVLAGGEPAPERSVAFDVLSQDRDQSGNRVRIIAAARPGLIIRLNAGTYQVVSTYGDANARVRADVTVEAGKLTEATLAQTGAKVTFKLVGREGGEALADVSWAIIGTKSETVKEAVGALPTHILAAGRYAVVAKHQGRTFRAEFTAKSGESAIVEVVAR